MRCRAQCASITRDGERWTTSAGDLVDEACEGVLNMEGRPVMLDDVSHPVNTRLALARAVRSVINVFGITWRDESGTRNAHYAPFSWSG